MKLEHPFIITARLCPGLKLTDDTTLSFTGFQGWSEDRREIAGFVIDGPGIEEPGQMRSGVGGFQCRLQDVFASYLAFLYADIEHVAYAERGNPHSVQTIEEVGFSMKLLQHLQGDGDEILMLRAELDEGPDLIGE